VITKQNSTIWQSLAAGLRLSMINDQKSLISPGGVEKDERPLRNPGTGRGAPGHLGVAWN
jgi:hypothetical protein